MKADVTVIFVNSDPIVFENGNKIFEHKFCDSDGFVGKFFTSKPLKAGEHCKVELKEDGGKYKFSLCK